MLDAGAGHIAIIDLLPAIMAIVGVGISWGIMMSKIENERARTDEVIKRIEDRIAANADKREETFRRMEDRMSAIVTRHDSERLSILEEIRKIENKLDAMLSRMAEIDVCRGENCFYRAEYERVKNRG